MAVIAFWCTGRKLPFVIAVLSLARHAFTARSRSITSYSRLLPVFLVWVWAAQAEGVHFSPHGSAHGKGCSAVVDERRSTGKGIVPVGAFTDIATVGSMPCTILVRCTWTVESTYGEVHSRVATPTRLQEIVGREDSIYQLGMQSCGEWSSSASCSREFTWAAYNFKWHYLLNVHDWRKLRDKVGPKELMIIGAAYWVMIYYMVVLCMSRLA